MRNVAIVEKLGTQQLSDPYDHTHIWIGMDFEDAANFQTKDKEGNILEPFEDNVTYNQDNIGPSFENLTDKMLASELDCGAHFYRYDFHQIYLSLNDHNDNACVL